MMREHLYRGIPKSDSDRHFFADIWKDNCEGSFVYGSLIISNDRYYICVSALCKINCCINNGMTSMIEVIPETVGQFTDMLDKNDKKIFEGDILKGMGGLHRVYFDNTLACFEWAKINGNWHESFSGFADEYEVVGNIHDNPELLKGGEG